MRSLVLLVPIALAGPCGCTPSDTPSCPTSFFGSTADYIAPKIPLNTQSDCSGASRVPLTTNSLTGAGAETCNDDPADSVCLACLRVQCCAHVDQACLGDGGALDPATCATDPGVESCILAALDDHCTAACGGGS